MSNRQRVREFLPVYVYNSVEDEWPYISGLKKMSDRSERITLSNAYADSYLFANAGRKKFVFVSPVHIPREFVDYYESLTGSHVIIINPGMKDPFISLNLLSDRRCFVHLLEEASGYGGISLFPYSTTQYLYKLKHGLEKKGLAVALPESPEEKNFWTVPLYGSKSGFRELIRSLPPEEKIRMPEGEIVSSIREALKKVNLLLEKNGAAILKISKGSGGHGTFILKNNSAPSSVKLKEILSADPLWKHNPIVVEEFIETDPHSPSPFPSIECYVDENGQNRILYYCSMLVTKEGNFFGMEVGKEAIPEPVRREMRHIGSRIGDIYAVNGYRGHCDIDMINGKNGTLYVNESNVRNTGGTDAYKIARFLLGDRLFSRSFLLSRFFDFSKQSIMPSFSEIVKKLAAVLYSPVSKTGVIISSNASLTEHSLTYFIIERNKKNAYRTEKRLLSIVRSILS